MTALIITLIIVGIILMVAEFLIIPGFGIAGIMGFISIAASCVLGFIYYSNAIGVLIIVINLLLLTFVTIFVLRSKTWKKLSLKTNIESKVDTNPPSKCIIVGLEG